QPMGFYAPAQIVRDARQHGFTVRPVCVNASGWDCTLEPADEIRHSERRRLAAVGRATSSPRRAGHSADGGETPPLQGFAVRLGLRMVKGLSQDAAGTIVAARS